jgi:hypothetical protein
MRRYDLLFRLRGSDIIMRAKRPMSYPHRQRCPMTISIRLTEDEEQRLDR